MGTTHPKDDGHSKHGESTITTFNPPVKKKYGLKEDDRIK